MRIKNKTTLIILLSIGLLFFISKYFGVIINITPSMKEGVYIKADGSIQRGDIVALCLKDPYKSLGLNKLYIEKGQKCNGADPLIKEVIAIPGDNVILENNYIEVNGTKLSYPTKFFDSIGRKLDIYPRGNYFSIKGYWVIGTNAANSWDSRYWGEINKNQILYKLHPLLVLSFHKPNQ